ncbi:hypothetical protein SKAU_G00210020 [Synaphobranchus kaupii]|uniref:Uncharacterized protein n=1 Tax=Synaphobranchus kaupii TaxID=118154 RepID=A0A9Q1F8V2_SYNKA|nr:hypothetical protein SKAU_G00210020 [Synaphobranchus kaupii]
MGQRHSINKGNFFLLCTEPFKRGFDISWNFFEASHGKGALDGIGGTLKQSADRLVCLGEDIPNAEVLFQKLNMQESSVQLFYVMERSVEEILAVPPLTAVKGMMKIHQIMSTSPVKIKYRDITCLCQKEKGVMDCPCFELKEATQAPDVPTTEPLWHPEVITSDHVGRWCVVRYDDDPYPGIIMAVEENNIQPADKSLFKSLKHIWLEMVRKWMRTSGGKKLPKQLFFLFVHNGMGEDSHH